MRFVANDVDNEVNRFRIDAQTTRDGIKARLQFCEQTNEFLRLKFGRRMLQKKIDYLHPPEINLEIVLVIGLEKVLQQRCCRSSLDDRFQEFRSGSGDGIAAKQCLAQWRGFIFSRRHYFVASGAKRANNFLD